MNLQKKHLHCRKLRAIRLRWEGKEAYIGGEEGLCVEVFRVDLRRKKEGTTPRLLRAR